MTTRLLAGLISTGLVLAPIVLAQAPAKRPASQPTDKLETQSMSQAIAWEHLKEVAAARQARLEAKHPSVTYSNADRSADRNADETTQGKPVKDPGPVKKDK